MKIDRLERRDEPNAVATLAAAFAQYALFPPLCPEAERRPRVIESFCRFLFRISLKHDGVFATQDCAAVACALPPGSEWPSEWAYVRSGVLSVMWRLGWRNGIWFARLGPAFDSARRKHLGNRPHWYLHLLGVRPEMKGRGLGRAVLQPIFEAADRERVPIYLETFPESNVPIYQKLGFDLLGRSDLPGGLPNWEMARRAR